jgi:hypothetical protein
MPGSLVPPESGRTPSFRRSPCPSADGVLPSLAYSGQDSVRSSMIPPRHQSRADEQNPVGQLTDSGCPVTDRPCCRVQHLTEPSDVTESSSDLPSPARRQCESLILIRGSLGEPPIFSLSADDRLLRTADCPAPCRRFRDPFRVNRCGPDGFWLTIYLTEDRLAGQPMVGGWSVGGRMGGSVREVVGEQREQVCDDGASATP